MRLDLLALTADDLAAIANRGNVKRATRELNAGTLRYDVQEKQLDQADRPGQPDGEEVVVEWSDGSRCVFPAGQTIHEATCSSGALGITRHIIRSVLAYQQHHAGHVERVEDEGPPLAETDKPPDDDEPSPVEAAPAPLAIGQTWDPGAISDEGLVATLGQKTVNAARRAFDRGVLVELTRGSKPTARFLHESVTVRFLVPGDVRYARSDCHPDQLSQWAVQAIWSFRELAADESAGLLLLGDRTEAAPVALLDRLRDLLLELIVDGLAGLPATWPSRAARLEGELRKAGLVWPAELMLELTDRVARYAGRDGRFDAGDVVDLIGEATARSRAIRSDRSPVPQSLVRGTKSDRKTDFRSRCFVGLGLHVVPGDGQTRLVGLFQDAESGTVVSVTRLRSDPDETPDGGLDSFTRLAAIAVARSVTLDSAARSQLMLTTGKRSPSAEVALPRTRAHIAVTGQNYQWESLHPPTLLDDFELVRSRVRSLPPVWLRPRRPGESVQVVPLAGVVGLPAETDPGVQFDPISQRWTATARDRSGGSATLAWNYHGRASAAGSDLAAELKRHGPQAVFVSGFVRLWADELEIEPLLVVFESPDGRRRAFSPMIESRDRSHSADPATVGPTEPLDEFEAGVAAAGLTGSIADPIAELTDAIGHELSEAVTIGLESVDAAAWMRLAALSGHCGFARWTTQLQSIADELGRRSETVRWDPRPTAARMAELAMQFGLLPMASAAEP